MIRVMSPADNQPSFTHMASKTRLLPLFAIALLAMPMFSRGDVSEERGMSKRFIGKLNPTPGHTNECEFSIEIEPMTFKVNSLQNRYKVVRIRVENRMKEAIKLSGEEDSIEVEVAGGSAIRGVFNLQAQDGPLWDSL